MRKALFIFAITLCLAFASHSSAADGFTQKDRELLIELKVKMGEIDKRFEQVDKGFEQVDKRSEGIERRLERLESVMMWGFGLLFTSMLGMVGFVLWDRRTAVAPVARVLREKEEEIEELKRRERIIEEAMRDYAAGDQRLAGILKAKGLM